MIFLKLEIIILNGMMDIVTVVEEIIDNEIVNTKEELFNKIAQAKSYYHVLELLKNASPIPLSKVERVNLMRLVNGRLRDLQQTRNAEDPYEKRFYHKKIG